jgi:hypothetical protein
MDSINFKFLFLLICILLLPSLAIYYYYYNYLAKPEPVILKSDNAEYKIKHHIAIKNLDDERLIYKSRINNFEESNFKVVPDYENPKKEKLIELQNLNSEKLDSIFDINKPTENSEINVVLKNGNYKNKTPNSIKSGTYYIELGTFISKERADENIKEIQYNNKKSLDSVSFDFKFINYKNKIFVKLIVPHINSFNEARQLCKIMKESQNYCLIKNY